jgi:hypothetical protein
MGATDGASARDGSSDSGAVLVEAVFAIVLLVALVGGVVHVGSTMGVRATVEHTARTLVRSAAADPSASSDTSLLGALASGLADDAGLRVQRLIVFRPQDDGPGIPQVCDQPPPLNAVPAGVAGVCNIFGAAHLAAVAAGEWPPPGCGPASWEAAWCPTTRVHGDAAPLVGVRIDALVEVPASVGFVPSVGSVVHATAVAAIDPEVE